MKSYKISDLVDILGKAGVQIKKTKGGLNLASGEIYLDSGQRIVIQKVDPLWENSGIVKRFSEYMRTKRSATICEIAEEFYREAYNPLCHNNRIHGLVHRAKRVIDIRSALNESYYLEEPNEL